MLKIKVTVSGLAPILQNRFPDEEHEDNASKKKKKVYVSADEAKTRLYLNSKGKICQPATHFEACLIKSATNFKFEGKKTYKDAFKGGIFIGPDMIPHKSQSYEVDRQPVVIQRSRIMRARPRIDKWELSFEIQVIDDRIEANVVKEVLEYAGLYIGIGDMRPRFGRFQIKTFKVIK